MVKQLKNQTYEKGKKGRKFLYEMCDRGGKNPETGINGGMGKFRKRGETTN